jgi:hypothetical protein
METGTIGLRQVFPAAIMEPVQVSVGHSASSEQGSFINLIVQIDGMRRPIICQIWQNVSDLGVSFDALLCF